MALIQNKGQLTTWKDDRGFGFIKPDDGGKEIFLHISALARASRRPKVGDIIFFDKVVEPNGKVRAARASIQGVKLHHHGTKQKLGWTRLLKSIINAGMLAAASFLVINFGRGHFLALITNTARPGCTIKGNISHNGDRKIYHIPGMEDYESTEIDSARGERWFCTEAEAIAAGWSRAPR